MEMVNDMDGNGVFGWIATLAATTNGGATTLEWCLHFCEILLTQPE